MSNYLYYVGTSAFLVSNAMAKGIMVYVVASSFSSRFRLTNDHVAPVSNMVGTVNPWVSIGKYKRPCCILTLLKCGQSTFPDYLISASYMHFLALSLSSCLDYLVSTFYYWLVASSKVFACCIEVYVVHPDNFWLYVQSSHNYSTSILATD